MSAVKKKITICIILFAVAGTVSLMSSSPDNSQLSGESILSGKNADIAAEFTKYIYNYASQKREREFNQRFFRIPVEDRDRIRRELQKIDKLGTPKKVTVPASGKNRRFVYYDKDDKHFYKFLLRNSKSKWFFQDLAVVEKE